MQSMVLRIRVRFSDAIMFDFLFQLCFTVCQMMIDNTIIGKQFQIQTGTIVITFAFVRVKPELHVASIINDSIILIPSWNHRSL